MSAGTQLKEQLKDIVPDAYLFPDEPMDRHTTFRAGGQADLFVRVQEVQMLRQVITRLQTQDVPYFLVGNGSNLLVSDRGYRGVILYLAGDTFRHIRTEGDTITAGAGATLNDVARRACDEGLKGLAFASGIPGTIGGALFMNAGAYGGEMKDVVRSVKVLDMEDAALSVREMSGADCRFGYRTSIAKEKKLCFLEVVLQLSEGNAAEIAMEMRALAARRREKQPLEYPSAGSTFKRPEGQFAGKLIMDAGLSGLSEGGAKIAEKHCGFVVNTGEATASEVYRLMQKVQKEVHARSGVLLEPEVIFLGDFSEEHT